MESSKVAGGKTWAFDIGTSSLGYAVRGYKKPPCLFSEVKSLLIPDGFASTKEAAERRRSYRTRQSHRGREEWLRKVFLEAGFKPLKPRNYKFCDKEPSKVVWDNKLSSADPRFELEFPKKGDETVYCGALLRAFLLLGRPLEQWQVYKAFHSAIQKRGYDSSIPWKNERDEGSDEEGEVSRTAQMMEQVVKDLPEAFQFPCFWEARRMGLWSPENPDKLLVRQNHLAQSATRQDVLHCGEESLNLYATHFDPQHADSKTRLTFKDKMDDAKAHYEEEQQAGDGEHERGKQRKAPFACELRSAKAIFPRHMVENELRSMFAMAEKQYPELSGKCDYLLYGRSETPYASYHANHKSDSPEKWKKVRQRVGHLVEGKAADLEGVLSQKIPTFDNRNPESCRLLPHLRVASVIPRVHLGSIVSDSVLPAEMTFLMKLKNFRFLQNRAKRGFSPVELVLAYTAATQRAQKAFAKKNTATSYVDQLKFTQLQLGKLTESFEGGQVAFVAEQSEIESPKLSGRSRFSRPACRIVKALILSGLAPEEFRTALLNESKYEELRSCLYLNTGTKFSLTSEHLEFLSPEKMGLTWEGIYLPNETLSHLDRMTEAEVDLRDSAIRKLIGQQLDPIVRHRLGFFHRTLRSLEKSYGVPDHVVLEFVREDFMGVKAKKDLATFQKKRRKERAKAREKSGANNRASLKYQLLEEQGYQCIYLGNCLKTTHVEDLEVEHIVPRAKGGPDAYYNYVVTKRETNEEKADRTPWEWLHNKGGFHWDAYCDRVNSRTKMKSGFNNKKSRLLTSEDASDQVSRYQTLAETAWIAKLAQTITCLHFGWPLNFKGEARRIVVLPGALTNKVARKYKLYSLLGDPSSHEEQVAILNDPDASADAIIAAENALEKKNRADKRHHALDAMVLSFIPQWAADEAKRIYHHLPEQIAGDRHQQKVAARAELIASGSLEPLGVSQREAVINRRLLELQSEKALVFFKGYLDEVVAHNVLFEKSELTQTLYGSMNLEGNPVAVYTRNLYDIAFTGLPKKFKLPTLKVNVRKIVSPSVKRALTNWLVIERKEAEWVEFLKTFLLPNGSRPVRVRMVDNELGQFADLSKDKTGSFRKGAKHKGYFVYLNAKGKACVKPVYAHQAVNKVRSELDSLEGLQSVGEYFESGCLVEIKTPLVHSGLAMPPGLYVLNSLRFDGRANFTAANGQKMNDIPLLKLMASGFCREG